MYELNEMSKVVRLGNKTEEVAFQKSSGFQDGSWRLPSIP